MKMELNAHQQYGACDQPKLAHGLSVYANNTGRYRPSSSKSHAMNQSSPVSATQMYSYNKFSFQRQQLPQSIHQMSRSSPPRSAWDVLQTQNSYYTEPRGSTVTTREEHLQFLPRSELNSSQAPIFSNAAFNNNMNANRMATSVEYLPNVIDTSTSCSDFVFCSAVLI